MGNAWTWGSKLLIVLAAAGIGGLPVACSGDGGGSKKKDATAPESPFKDYAIHIYAKTKSGFKQVDLPPVHSVSAPSKVALPATAKVPGSKAGSLTPGQQPQTQIGWDAGSLTLEESIEGLTEPGWALLLRAVAQCHVPHDLGGENGSQLTLDQPWWTRTSPWQGNWYVFGDTLTSGGTHTFAGCEEILRKSETLVCAAGKLKEAADTLSPVVWPAVPDVSFGGGAVTFPPWIDEEWVIPPQRGADKFILRDLAINALAHAGRLQLEVPNGSYTLPTGMTCMDAYVAAAKDPGTFYTANWQALFAPTSQVPFSYFTRTWPVDPNQSGDPPDPPSLAEARLRFMTHILTAGSRLLKDLIDESVMADLAGAEKQRALAGDAKRGPALYWGATTDSEAPYNSLAHAFRVIFGRWDSARPTSWDALPQPSGDAVLPAPVQTCGGTLPMELLVRADGSSPLGPGQSARWQDRRILSRAQQDAVSLIDRAGIVAPKVQLDAQQSNFGIVKTAIKDQLLLSAAHTDDPTGFSLTDPITLERKKTIDAAVDKINDKDLRFALDRAWNSYRITTGASENETAIVAPDSQKPLEGPSGVHLVDTAALDPLVATVLGGNVLAAGAPRHDTATDIMARVGPGQALSMCSEFWAQGAVPGNANMGKVSAFQDAFMLGDLFRRRLSALRQAVEDPTPFAYPTTLTQPPCTTCEPLGASSFPKLAGAGAAEVRAWTGPAHVMLFNESNAFGFAILGLAAEELGVNTRQQMKEKIRLVWGEPWVADCASRTRESCPPGFMDDYVQGPTKELVDDQEFSAAPPTGLGIPVAAITGADERAMYFEFPKTGAPKFNPTATPLGYPSGAFLYLVALHDPTQPGKGRVLATFPYYDRVEGSVFYGLSSGHQRKLANDLFGVARGYAYTGRTVGKSSATDSPSYCIDDVPRDFFVPLENELTSDNDGFEDSWKHYLDAAKAAAARADELGNKLIDLGLQQDYRREAANEEVAQNCGEYGATEDLKIKNGEVSAPDDDSALGYCLNEPKYEIVFLSKAPPAKKDDNTPLDVRNHVVGCNANPVDPVAESSPICTKYGGDSDDENLRKEMGALNFAPYFDGDMVTPPDETVSCDAAIGVVTSLKGAGFEGDKLQALATDADMDRDAIGAVVHGLRVSIDADLNWTVKLDDAAIMSTTDANLWPNCTAPCGTGPYAALSSQFADIFDYVGGGLSDANRDIVLQRVTGTIWLMAAMGGHLPEGAFKLPVPARTGFTTGSEQAAVLYGAGQFTQGGVLETAVGNLKIPDGDIKILGPGTTITAAFANGVNNSTFRPKWLQDVYGAASNFLHVSASSSARKFPAQKNLVDFFSKRGNDLKGVTNASCAGVNSNITNAAADAILKLKYPTEIAKLCSTPDGKNPMLIWSAGESGIADIFQYSSGDSGDPPASSKIPNSASGALGVVRWNHSIASPDCPHSRAPVEGFSVLQIANNCLNHVADLGPTINPYSPHHTRFTINALLPSGCSQGERAQLFVNASTPYSRLGLQGPCEAAAELSRTLAFTCVLNRTYRPLAPGEALPPLNEPKDIILLENWLLDLAHRSRISLSKLYLTDVPKRVVDDFQAGKVGSGALKGEHGQLVLQYRQHLSTLASGWLALEKEFQAVRLAVVNARLGLEAVNLAKQEELKILAMQEVQLNAQMLKGAIQIAGSVAASYGGVPTNVWNNAAAVGQAGVDIASAYAQQQILSDIKNIKDKKAANQVLQTLTVLQENVNERHGNIQQTLQSMQAATAGALQTAAALKQKENDAKYHAAKGAGEPYVMIEGKAVGFPVNAVLRNQYDITKRRYDAALKESKYMAYMARLAIEQRIGMRMNDMHEPLGALPAPSEWADDVCSFQGVNYELLRGAGDPPPANASWLEQLFYQLSLEYGKHADPYIGDYVDRLEKFVEFYNIAYPSHEGDDVAVLSVRDDLMGPQGKCYKPSRNLLYYSHELDKRTGTEEGETFGWVLSGCEEGPDPDAGVGKCLRVTTGSIITSGGQPLPTPGVAPTEGFTWLKDAPISEFEWTDPSQEPPQTTTYTIPPGSVYQAVQLGAGNHVLSWFDRAWGADAETPATSPGGDYRVMVYGPNWEIVASYIAPAYVPDGDAGTPDPWSPRRHVAFATTTPGTHYVLLGPSLAGTALGSVLVANMQLEVAATAAVASAYEPTSASRLTISGDCTAGSASAFRSAFQYACDNEACFYELRQPFIIDTRAVDSAESKLIGKIAEGNFNFRHITTALNIVGTGVTDCAKTPTPSCYGTGYIEYSLFHNAFAAPVVSHLPEYQAEFNFGAAAINRGKALAAERFITVPIGSADQGLLSQAQITKQEYRGRPLSGSYRLRIYDAPNLVWSQVEDVQVVLNYRYWSRVERESQTK